MRIIVINHVSLDGVMQGPGDVNEDTRGGFTLGGLAAARNDPAMLQAIGQRMSVPDSGMLLGRWTYQSLLSSWNAKGGPYKDALNSVRKYVVSKNSAVDLPWPNSTLIHGNTARAIEDLRAHPGGNIVIMGSGKLIRSLIPNGFIDEYLLMIHPILLGSGKHLFGILPTEKQLELRESTVTPSGVIIGTFVLQA